MPYFETYVDSLNGCPESRFIISLGPLPDDVQLTEGQSLVIERPSLDAIKQFNGLNPRNLGSGVAVYIDSATHAANAEIVELLQRYLAYWFVKFIQMPLISTKIPDELGIREVHPEDPPTEINKLRNLPLHLSCPIVDKAQGAGKGFPAIIVIPGPSLNALRGKLKAISAKAIIICISRTLQFVLDEGVEPDLVIQLDTHCMQEQLFPARQFESTYLLALSLTNISRVAHRFRRTFFVESFDTTILRNPFRPKESWLSSLLLCIGIAEILQLKEMHLAGADLSFPCRDGRYYNAEGACSLPETSPTVPDILRINHGEFLLKDRKGCATTTTMQYYATAFEADLFAQDVAQSTGTRFFNLTDTGILPRDLFPATPESHFETLPDFNRPRFQKRLDAMAHLEEEIHYGTLRAKLDLREKTLTQTLRFAAHTDPSSRPEDTYPLFGTTRTINLDNPGIGTSEEHFFFTRGLLEVWLAETRRAIKVTRLYSAARLGPVNVLCCPEEVEACAERLQKTHPRWSFKLQPVVSPFSGADNGASTPFNQLYANHLRGDAVVLVTEGLFRRFDFLLRAIPQDNVLEYREDSFL